jgi:undecaprenyl-diphosphatase
LCLLALFGWLSQEVLEQESFGFDSTILWWLHQHSNSTIDQLMLNITNLGNPPFVVTLVVASLSLLLWYRRFWAAQILLLTCLGALILNQGLKLVFAKPRPQLWTPLIVEHTYSFPSGHALGSAVLYGFLAVLLASQYPRYRAVIYAIAISIVGSIKSIIIGRSLPHRYHCRLCSGLSLVNYLYKNFTDGVETLTTLPEDALSYSATVANRDVSI